MPLAQTRILVRKEEAFWYAKVSFVCGIFLFSELVTPANCTFYLGVRMGCL